MITGNYKTFAFVSNDQFLTQTSLHKNASNTGADLRYYRRFIHDNVEVVLLAHTPMELVILSADVKLALDCDDCIEDNSDYRVTVRPTASFDGAYHIVGTGAQAH